MENSIEKNVLNFVQNSFQGTEIDPTILQISEVTNEPSVPVNIYENEGEYRVELLCPGFDKNDFDVDFQKDDILTISTDRVENENGNIILRKEFTPENFSKSIQFPKNIGEGDVDVFYKGGILTIVIPKDNITFTEEMEFQFAG
jgi:HSP20 family molecular chaperone IbpA